MSPPSVKSPPGVQVLGPVTVEQAAILSVPAQAFVATLHRCFNQRRLELLQRRADRQLEIDAGRLPDFLPETRDIREDPSWRGAPPAPGMVRAMSSLILDQLDAVYESPMILPTADCSCWRCTLLRLSVLHVSHREAR